MRTILFNLVLIVLTLNVNNRAYSQEENRRYELLPEKSKFTWVGHKEEKSFSGTFSLKSGYIEFEDEELTQAVVFADMSTIKCDDCGEQEEARKLMEFVKSNAFLNVDNMDFSVFKMYKSAKMPDSKDGNYRLEGALTIIGYTNNISLPVMVLEKKEKVYVEGKITMNRSLWKLNNPAEGKPEDYIGQTIELYVNLEGEKK